MTRPEDVLGVPPNAARDELRRAMRRFVRAHHPDVGGDRAEFERGVRAYETLVRRQRRSAPPEVFRNTLRAQLARWLLRRARRLGLSAPRVR